MAIALRTPDSGHMTFNGFDGPRLTADVRAKGLNPDDIFFKCNISFYNRYDGSFAHFRYSYNNSYFSKERTTVADEFGMLSILHGMLPGNVSAPIGKVTRGLPPAIPFAVGYFAEYIPGTTMLHDYLMIRDGPRDLGRSMLPQFLADCDELQSIIRHINSGGFAHGDAVFSNAIRDPDGRMKLIDPLPIIKDGRLDLGLLMDRDAYQIERIDEYKEFLSHALR